MTNERTNDDLCPIHEIPKTEPYELRLGGKENKKVKLYLCPKCVERAKEDIVTIEELEQ
jgi:hypothetical protein